VFFARYKASSLLAKSFSREPLSPMHSEKFGIKNRLKVRDEIRTALHFVEHIAIREAPQKGARAFQRGVGAIVENDLGESRLARLSRVCQSNDRETAQQGPDSLFSMSNNHNAMLQKFMQCVKRFYKLYKYFRSSRECTLAKVPKTLPLPSIPSRQGRGNLTFYQAVIFPARSFASRSVFPDRPASCGAPPPASWIR